MGGAGRRQTLTGGVAARSSGPRVPPQELEGWERGREGAEIPSSSSSNDLINKAVKEGRSLSEATSLLGGGLIKAALA